MITAFLSHLFLILLAELNALLLVFRTYFTENLFHQRPVLLT